MSYHRRRLSSSDEFGSDFANSGSEDHHNPRIRSHRPHRPHRPPSPLSPPRPFFLAGSASNHSSVSSCGDNSDSDREAGPQPTPLSNKRHLTHAERQRLHHSRRRSSMSTEVTNASPADPPPLAPPQRPLSSRFPPSSFTFPFQAFAGNPDPGTPIPASYLRSMNSSNLSRGRRSSLSAINASFSASPSMVHSRSTSSLNSVPVTSVYRNSAAAALVSPRDSVSLPLNDPVTSPYAWQIRQQPPPLPKSPSQIFRSPFLSPSSRPASVIGAILPSATRSHAALSTLSSSAIDSAKGLPPVPAEPPLPRPSARLLDKDAEKPWLSERAPKRVYLSWWLTFACALLGLLGGAAVCFDGVRRVKRLNKNQLCLVMEDNFEGGSINDANWAREIGLGGFGNGEFQMYTGADANAYIKNNQLYIFPALTTDTYVLSPDDIFNGANFTLDGCTVTIPGSNQINRTACSVTSSRARGTVIPPATSARLTTRGKATLRYGKVEVRAKLPRGAWLWPAIWMLPQDEVYGQWPLSGEIDIMESRGNEPNTFASSLVFGPLPSLARFITGTLFTKRVPFSSGFHTYALEWTSSWMRIYVDERLRATIEISLRTARESPFRRGAFPQVAHNGSAGAVVAVQNPWANSGNNAPFDQGFYLVLDVAVGGTSGWFPDGVDHKPWFDSSISALRDFAHAQDQWYRTWPTNPDERALRIDSVKMWKLC